MAKIVTVVAVRLCSMSARLNPQGEFCGLLPDATHIRAFGLCYGVIRDNQCNYPPGVARDDIGIT